MKRTMDEVLSDGKDARARVLGAGTPGGSALPRNEFTADLIDYAGTVAWGLIWTRPGLPQNVRSLLTIAMMAVMNRPQELQLHVRGALANGVTAEELKEVLLQVTCYAGMPCGIEAFKRANEVLDETSTAK